MGQERGLIYMVEIIACKVIHTSNDNLHVHRYTQSRVCRVIDYNDNGIYISIIYYGEYAIPKPMIIQQYIRDKHKHTYI